MPHSDPEMRAQYARQWKERNSAKVAAYRVTERAKVQAKRASKPRTCKPEKTPAEIEAEKKRKYEYIKQWKKDNPDKVKEYSRRQSSRHKDRRRAYAIKWRNDNKTKFNEYSAEWRRNNADKVKVAQAKYHATNKTARLERSRKWQAENPDKVFATYRRNFIRKNFGLTLQDYDNMLYGQNGVCAICNNTETATVKGRVKLLAVDHNHLTGVIRGLLCTKCNALLAHCRESCQVLEHAKLYLEKQLPLSDRDQTSCRTSGLPEESKTRYERVNRRSMIKRLYGITEDVYLSLLSVQGGLCRICRQMNEPNARGKIRKLSVDHDHATKAIRGLLCCRCNFLLGCASDNVSILQNAIVYLERWSSASG